MRSAHRSQQPIRCSRTDREELVLQIYWQAQLVMALERFHELGQKRNETFGAKAVGDLPQLGKRPTDRLVVDSCARPLDGRNARRRRMPEQAQSILAVVAARASELIQYPALLLPTSSSVSDADFT